MSLRSLVCIGVTEAFFSADEEERTAVFHATRAAFDDMPGRFGVKVLGTFDDDTLQIGPSIGFPWTCYLLLEVPSYDAATAITDAFRHTPVGDRQLWRYYKVEARLGRALFFGEEPT